MSYHLLTRWHDGHQAREEALRAAEERRQRERVARRAVIAVEDRLEAMLRHEPPTWLLTAAPLDRAAGHPAPGSRRP